MDFGDPEADARAREDIYLDELARQSLVANHSFAEAWKRAMSTNSVRDDLTWMYLQSALFASIVIVRLLKPGRVYAYPGMSKSESQEYADNRGRHLRDVLEVEDHLPLFSVQAVRDSLEHFDERLDRVFVSGVSSLSDWSIVDGVTATTSAAGEGVGLRIFYPLGGLVLFDQHQLDIFALDVTLLELRGQIEKAKERERPQSGAGRVGPHQIIEILDPEVAFDRATQWLKIRDELGMGLGLSLQSPADGSES